MICWTEERLRSLGGKEDIELALSLACKEIKEAGKELPIWIFTHVGFGAGQNFSHQHWHMLTPATTPRAVLPLLRFKVGQLLRTSNNFAMIVDGARAGQTFILPISPTNPLDTLSRQETRTEIATEVSWVIETFNRKFDYPDFSLALELNSDNDWRIRYVPILNNWGATEFAAIDYGTPFTLPFSHEAVVNFLIS